MDSFTPERAGALTLRPDARNDPIDSFAVDEVPETLRNSCRLTVMENCKSRTLPRAGSVSASRIADRKGAHGRANSDRAVDRPCSRLIRPQGPHPRTAACRACFRKSHAVGCCWWHKHNMDSGAMRIRASITRPGSTSRTRGHEADGHTPFLWPFMLRYLLLPASVQWLHLGSGCRPTARKGSWRTWLVHDQRPPCWQWSRHCRIQPSGRAGGFLDEECWPIEKGWIRNSRRTSTSKTL